MQKQVHLIKTTESHFAMHDNELTSITLHILNSNVAKRGLKVKEIMSSITATLAPNPKLCKQQMNRVLYALQNDGLIQRSEENPPTWSLVIDDVLIPPSAFLPHV